MLNGLPHGWVGRVFASDAPEVSDVKFGIIALTDCSPIVIAHEKGFFKKYGITATVNKGANWAAIRDALSNGDNHATHMLLGMPIASSMGLLGSPRKPMIVPWLLNRNGQSITLANKFKGKVTDDPKALADDVARLPLIAVDFPKFGDGRGFSTARLLRERYGFRGELRAIGDVLRDQLYSMAECGIDAFSLRPDRDPHDALLGLHDFTGLYASSAREPRPWFLRREAPSALQDSDVRTPTPS